MNITQSMSQHIRNLKNLLREACHSKGCTRTKICPRQCRCRTERTFELNTDTAICWEIADLLKDLQRCERVNKEYVKEIRDKITAYAEVTRHHSSKGWQRFFWKVETTYATIIGHYGWPDESVEGLLEILKIRLTHLKRYPREM